MAEETWHVARLIPTSGISGAEEQERRATSALLAVMAAVKEFARTLTAPLGGPAGQVETFIEVPFILASASSSLMGSSGSRAGLADGSRSSRSRRAPISSNPANSRHTSTLLVSKASTVS